MDVDEIAALEPETLQMRRHAGLGGRSRHQQHAPLFRRRLDADAAQRVEVGLDHVAQGVARRRLNVGETLLPVFVAPGDRRPDRPARLEQAAQPGATPVFGEVDDQIVTARLQGVVKRQFGAGLAGEAEFFPLPVDGMHLRNRRMQGQHLGRIGIDQRVDLDLQRMGLEHRKHRRTDQHVAVVAQFDDQRAADFANG